MTVFTCEDDYESMMTCIYDAWASGLGHENVRLEVEPVYQTELFSEYIHVDGDEKKAESVTRSVRQKISYRAAEWVYAVSRSDRTDRLDMIYRFLVFAFKKGHSATDALSEPSVMYMMKVDREVGREGYLFREFMRFSSFDGKLYVAHFEPKADVILHVADHFADRMGGEYWIIIDDTRNIAAVHPKNEDVYLRKLSCEEAALLKKTEERDDMYVHIWKEYVDTIAIKERTNPKCQMSHFPLWMRKHAVEFSN